jgi:NADH:ubiquinone reductase (H+-translocating)
MRITHPQKQLGKKIVIVIGGGFAGLNAAKKLADQPDVFVILMDQRNHHLFQPLLYQVATAGLNPGDIAVPIRAQFSDSANVEVHWGRVERVDLEQKFVAGGETELEFDYLVIACGAQHSYFAHPEWEKFAPGLKTLEQATEIRRRILSAFEDAENELDLEKQQAMLNFVIVGGGPTGVELAGAIADISRTVLIDDFRRIEPERANVILVEAGSKVLASFDPQLQARTKDDLEELGVQIRLNARVEKIDENGVQIGPELIPSKTVFWAAGVQAAKMQFNPPIDLDRAGRVKVAQDLSVPGHPDVFVVGDMAAFEIEPGKLVPGLAPAAMQEGKRAAKNILASVRGLKRKAFKYNDKGQMATIGKNRAVMQSGSIKMGGYIAWLAWLFVHIFYLIGFRNRVSVMTQWAWSYLFSKRGARLITDRDWKLKT